MATYGAYKVNMENRLQASRPGKPVHLCPSLTSSPLSLSQQHAAWIIPFFCYQIFDFVLNTLVAISVVVYPNTVQDYLQQLVRSFQQQFSTGLTQNQTLDVLFLCLSLSQPGTFPYKEDIMSTNNMCLVFAVLIFIGCILSFKVSSGSSSSSKRQRRPNWCLK